MDFLKFLAENWSLIVAAIAGITCIVGAVIKFVVLPSEKQITNLKEWLRWAVTEAEKELGSGTGQLKLRDVYDMAVERFPWVERFVTFNEFSIMVDDALDWMRDQLKSNDMIKEYVERDDRILIGNGVLVDEPIDIIDPSDKGKAE